MNALRLGIEYVYNRRSTMATFFCFLALFTISWDVIGNLGIGGFNVKVSVVSFGLAFVLAASVTGLSFISIVPRPLVYLAIAMILILLVASGFAEDRVAGYLTVARVVVGALLPGVAILAVSTLGVQFADLLKWLVWGGLFATAFGVYQLIAFYLHLPQFVDYIGVSGGVGRIASFSYEPAQFAYFLVITIVAAVVRYRLKPTKFALVQLAALALVLVLVNSRAVFLTLPLLIILLRPVASGLLSRRAYLTMLGSAFALGAVVMFAIPSLSHTVISQFLSIFNPNEQASNAPRLELIDAALRLTSQHLWTGVGPSNFGLYIEDLHYQQYAGAALNQMVVNNIWLQALMDGGVFLLLCQAGFVAAVVSRGYLGRGVNARLLLAGWISVILVGGAVVSNFYEAKLWVALALALVAGAKFQARAGPSALDHAVGSPRPVDEKRAG